MTVAQLQHERKNKVWFITGASSGFGKALAEQVLAQHITCIGKK